VITLDLRILPVSEQPYRTTKIQCKRCGMVVQAYGKVVWCKCPDSDRRVGISGTVFAETRYGVGQFVEVQGR
jgi:hypothetical protein